MFFTPPLADILCRIDTPDPIILKTYYWLKEGSKVNKSEITWLYGVLTYRNCWVAKLLCINIYLSRTLRLRLPSILTQGLIWTNISSMSSQFIFFTASDTSLLTFAASYKKYEIMDEVYTRLNWSFHKFLGWFWAITNSPTTHHFYIH